MTNFYDALKIFPNFSKNIIPQQKPLKRLTLELIFSVRSPSPPPLLNHFKIYNT